jgi:hypothetical protein
MRPVHDGADPEGEEREIAERQLRTAASWSQAVVVVALGVALTLSGAGWPWWVAVALLLLGILLVLELVVWPRVVRRATPWLLARKNRRNAR